MTDEVIPCDICGLPAYVHIVHSGNPNDPLAGHEYDLCRFHDRTREYWGCLVTTEGKRLWVQTRAYEGPAPILP